MSSSKISGLSHPDRSQLGSLTIFLTCCVVKVAGMSLPYCISRLTGVTVSRVLSGPSISIGLVVGLEAFRGEIDGEGSASLLFGLFTGVKEVFGEGEWE